MGRTPILDLDALVPERPLIRIRTAEDRAGRMYELRVKSELSVSQLQRLYRIGDEGKSLMETTGGDMDKMTQEDADRLGRLVDELLGVAFVEDYAPLQGVLPLEHKVAVMTVFSNSLSGTAEPTGTTETPTGE